MKDILKQYHNVMENIQDHFECGGLYQIDDATEYYWKINDNEVLLSNIMPMIIHTERMITH